MKPLKKTELLDLDGGLSEQDKDYISGVACASGVILGTIISGGLFGAFLISAGLHFCAVGLLRTL